MAPFLKRKKAGSGEGSSSQSGRFDRTGFLGPEQEARYHELESRVVWSERTVVPIDHGHFQRAWTVLSETCWDKLFTPPQFYQVEIVREFYANALPPSSWSGTEAYPFKTWVRGKAIDFSKEAIFDFLDNPLALVEECEYHPRLNRGNWDAESIKERICRSGFTYTLTKAGLPKTFTRIQLTEEAQLVTSVVLYNIRPRSHTSSITIDTAGLVQGILKGDNIDVSRIVANELKRVSLNGTVHGDGVKCRLIFPGLIMGLCRKAGVRFPSGGMIPMDGVIDDIFANRYCLPGGRPFGAARSAPALPDASEAVSVAAAPPVGSQFGDASDWNYQMHMAHQRAFMFLQDSIRQLSLQQPVGTRDDLSAYASWPEGRPDSEEGMEQDDVVETSDAE